jgi:hypothetical protein
LVFQEIAGLFSLELEWIASLQLPLRYSHATDWVDMDRVRHHCLRLLHIPRLDQERVNGLDNPQDGH